MSTMTMTRPALGGRPVVHYSIAGGPGGVVAVSTISAGIMPVSVDIRPRVLDHDDALMWVQILRDAARWGAGAPGGGLPMMSDSALDLADRIECVAALASIGVMQSVELDVEFDRSHPKYPAD
jgi:hypothetical protein